MALPDLSAPLLVERLLANGSGLARVDGRVVFVPGALPGDRVRVEVVREAKRHVEARVVELVEPSPDRRAPRCRHFGACGGCALQDLAYPAQLAAKRAIVLDALRSIAGFVPQSEPEVLASPEYGARTRSELQVDRSSGRARPAAHRVRSRDLEPLLECPVLVPDLEETVRELADGRRPIEPQARTLRLAAGDGGAVVAQLDADGRVLGDATPVVQRVAGFEFHLDAPGFFQGNGALVERLVELATAGARGALAFDLYAGSGLFSLPLARGFDLVMAVEEDPRAADRARANAQRNGRANVKAEAQDVGRWLARARRLGPDFVLLDPPRAGTRPGVADAVAALGAPQIRYVACDPAGFARDFAVLRAAGYRLEQLVLLDLFPQTLHVELVARLTRDL